MNTRHLTVLCSSLFLLSACYSTDGFMTDSYDSSPAVTHPAPRATVSHANNRAVNNAADPAVQTTPGNASQLAPVPMQAQAVPQPATGNSKQTVVPNVAPTLGE